MVPVDCRMNDGKIDYQTADIQDGAVHGIGEYNFPWLELSMENHMVAPIWVVKI
jgi:hypothetical protein